MPACGAFVDFHGGLHVMCFSLQAASIYAVGQVDLGIAADTKAGISLHMKFGFGVEIVVGLAGGRQCFRALHGGSRRRTSALRRSMSAP